jgi:hypothetical protein
MLKMKIVYIHKTLILSTLLAVLQLPAFSQESVTADQFKPEGGDHKGKLLSTYREFYKWEEYDLALDSWMTLFNEYPDASEKIYVDGVTMYRQFIEGTPEGQARENKIDTLMLIYDQRITYYGGEGNVLGRKGNDLLKYRSSEKEHVHAAYDMLKKSLEIQGAKSRETVMRNYISTGLMLENADMIDNNQVMEDYFMVAGLLEELEGTSSRWEKTRAAIDEMIMKEDVLTCEGMDQHFGGQYEQKSGDTEFLKKVISYYTSTGCTKSDFYTTASEKLYELEPGPESAHNLAILFISKDDLEKAIWYLKMAVVGNDISEETLAEWFYELSIISLAMGDHCGAIDFAREASGLINDYGKAYIALGDAFIASRKELGDDFQQQSAYWAAADMYKHAAKVDTALSEESNKKLDLCVAHFPSKEDIFFQDYKLGEDFMVGGCIRENTTIRSSD